MTDAAARRDAFADETSPEPRRRIPAPAFFRAVGRYDVYNAIARGGMATLHLARLRGAGGFARVVAVKRLHEQYATQPAFVTMFQDEALLAARIRHPNVVPILDVVASDDDMYIVLEYIHGETLARLLDRATERGELPEPSVSASIVCDLLRGLHAAHEAVAEDGRHLEIVHRDVSPQNVIIGTDGLARVLDFGVAKARGRLHTTQDGSVKGKLGYMPPEQLYGEAVDRRADVYAAGVVLWEMLTGERLFAGAGGEPAPMLTLTAEIRPPSLVRPDVPVDLDDIVLKALHRERDRRFASAADMADAVEAAVTRAAATDVARWVESLAASALAARVTLVAAVERAAGIDALATTQEMAPSPAALGEAARTRPQAPEFLPSVSTGNIAVPAPHAGRTTLLLLALVALGLAGVVWTLRAREPVPSSAPVPAATTDTSPALPHVAAADAAQSAEPTPSAEHDKAAVSTGAARSPAHTKALPPPRIVPRPTGNAPARPVCDPPYTIDEKGHKRYKLECLR